MKKQIIYLLITAIVGATLIVFGGYDDSPGAQFLGLILIVVGILRFRKARKDRVIF